MADDMPRSDGATAAIWYAPEDYDTSAEELVGRQAAGESFLTAYIRSAGDGPLYPYTGARASLAEFLKISEAVAGNPCDVRRIRPREFPALAEVGALHYPSPGIGRFAWERRRANQRSYSLTGVFHTTCTHDVMDQIGEFLMAPVQQWDAVICTSTAMKTMVEKVLEETAEYLAERMSARPSANIQLPVIPLGVDWSAFNGDWTGEARARTRAEFGIAEDDFCILFMGRLNFALKSNPYPMMVAAQRTAKALEASGRKVHLIQAGWFASEFVGNAMKEAAQTFAPDVLHHFPDGRVRETRRDIWHGADIFCSLSDNIQETFGLTPVEAMAAGLPVVVSDWDGYRDTVRDGVDGVRLPTVAPAPGAGRDLAYSYEIGAIQYAEYCGAASEATSVDVNAASEAFLSLATDSNLRRRLGEAGRERAREVFDWPVVMNRYRALWAELGEIRAGSAPESAPRAKGRAADPRRQDPFDLFSEYPTLKAGPHSRVELIEGANVDFEAAIASPTLNVMPNARGEAATARALLAALARGPGTVAELCARADVHRIYGARAVVWLSKIGMVSIENPDG